MIHIPVKKEPDSEQGHNRLDMVHKGGKRHLEYRESLDDDRVDQHMEDPDSERYQQQQQHQRRHDQPSSSSSSAGYYPQDHHHRGPPSGGDPAGYHSSGSYQDSIGSTYTHDTSNKIGTSSGGDFIVDTVIGIIIVSSFVIGSVGTGSSRQRGREQWQQQEANDACKAQVSRV
ncbi:hypothetical protein BGZ91_009547 [Linnemannia elongata]|nr:hypothetical protein BGZ91_009547 [Linnemannia elongata]